MRPRALFLALGDNVGLERVIGGLAEHKVDCALLSPPGFWSAQTESLCKRFLLPPHLGYWLGAIFVRGRLEALQRSWSPDIIVPLDDLSSALLSELLTQAGVSAGLRTVLRASLGVAVSGHKIRTRTEAIDVAASLGVRVPLNRSVDSLASALETAEAWGYPVVLKRDHTCGGEGVVIAHSREELVAGFNRNFALRLWQDKVKQGAKRAVWRLAGAEHLAAVNLSIQQYVAGRPAMRTVTAWKGRVLEGVSFAAEQNNPPVTGASTVIRHIENWEMEEASRKMVADLGCSGFISFDFIIEDDHGRAHLIEVNSRPIGSVHIGRRFGHNVCGALAAQLGAAAAPPESEPLLNTSVALFPKELLRNPDFLSQNTQQQIFHDVPWNDRRLLGSYLADLARRSPGIQVADLDTPWPRRRRAHTSWAARPAQVLKGLTSLGGW